MPYNLTELPEINDEIEVPEGSDIVSRSALISVFQRLANRTRNLMNRLGGRTGSGEWSYLDADGNPITKSRDVRINQLDAVALSGTVTFGLSTVTVDSGRIAAPIRLPRDFVLRQVLVEGTRVAGIGITVTARILKNGSAIWGPATDSSSGDDFFIQNASLNETIDPAAVYVLEIETSGTATVTRMRVTADDPGPRSF